MRIVQITNLFYVVFDFILMAIANWKCCTPNSVKTLMLIYVIVFYVIASKISQHKLLFDGYLFVVYLVLLCCMILFSYDKWEHVN